MRVKWLTIGVAVVFAVACLSSGPAYAHPRVARVLPAPGSVITVAPKVVRIWFKLDPNEELDPKRSALSVRDAHGARVDDGKGGVDLYDLDRLSLIARLKPLGPGTYTVRWRAVSTPDRGERQGTFRFTVARSVSLPPLRFVSPQQGAAVMSPIEIIFETEADLAKMTIGPHEMTMGRTHLHIDLDRRLIMPTMKQITRVGAGRYRVSLGRAVAGPHTIRLYWADSKHRPMGPVQSIRVTLK